MDAWSKTDKISRKVNELSASIFYGDKEPMSPFHTIQLLVVLAVLVLLVLLGVLAVVLVVAG